MNQVLKPGMLEAPVLVWTVGKVASSSIYATLKHYGVDAIHLHYLSDWYLTHQVNHMYRGQKLPLNIATSLRFRHAFDRGLFKGPLRIVTLVRDPLARNISAYFENLGHFSKGGVGPEAEAHIDNFLKRYPHEIALEWFDYEVRDVTGLDYREIGFDPAKGWCIHRNDEFELLVLRAEDADELKLAALSEFLGAPIVEMKRENDASSKAYRALYDDFRASVAVPRTLVDFMYDNEFCSTFWSPTEIARMRGAWRVFETAEPTAASAPASVAAARPDPTRPQLRLHAAQSAVVRDVRSKWTTSFRSFDSEANLRITFAVERAIVNPSLRVTLYTSDNRKIASIKANGAVGGVLEVGAHEVNVELVDLPLTKGHYACDLVICEDGAQIQVSKLAPLRVEGMRGAEGDQVAFPYRWTQGALGKLGR